jgi:hypothetical protein
VKQRSSTASTLAAIGGNPALADLTEPGHIFRNVTSRAGVEVLTREIRGMAHPKRRALILVNAASPGHRADQMAGSS